MFGFSSTKQKMPAEHNLQALAMITKLPKYSVYFIFALAIIWAYLKITADDTFPIRHVGIIDPPQHINRAELKQMLMPIVTHGFFNVDVTAIKNQLNLLPWVQQATVRRIWPDQVRIKITEKQPSAIWNRHQLVTAGGIVFTPDKASMPQNLPQIIAPSGTETSALQGYHTYQNLLQPLGLQITALTITSQQGVTLGINHQFIIVLGQQQQEARLQRFIQVFPKIFAGKLDNLISVDLQYRHGMAVRWRDTERYS